MFIVNSQHPQIKLCRSCTESFYFKHLVENINDIKMSVIFFYSSVNNNQHVVTTVNKLPVIFSSHLLICCWEFRLLDKRGIPEYYG